MKKKTETIFSLLKQIRDILIEWRGPIDKSIAEVKNSRFVHNSNSTVTDKHLNLIWHPTLPKRMTWEEAKKECQKIGYRLPTRQELESLLDLTKYNPAIDKEMFPDTKIDDWYWTGDTVAGYPGSAWCVGFTHGSVGNWYEGNVRYVRPVRSSQ